MKDTGTAGRVENPPRSQEMARGRPDGNMSGPPRHIAIIMDGNGRWATKRGLPRTVGHKAGAETFRRIATYCKEIGVKYLTVYAFSTENWKRSADEVAAIMGLLKRYLLEAVDTMERDHIRLHFFGDMGPIAPRQSTPPGRLKSMHRSFVSHLIFNLRYTPAPRLTES